MRTRKSATTLACPVIASIIALALGSACGSEPEELYVTLDGKPLESGQTIELFETGHAALSISGGVLPHSYLFGIGGSVDRRQVDSDSVTIEMTREGPVRVTDESAGSFRIDAQEAGATSVEIHGIINGEKFSVPLKIRVLSPEFTFSYSLGAIPSFLVHGVPVELTVIVSARASGKPDDDVVRVSRTELDGTDLSHLLPGTAPLRESPGRRWVLWTPKLEQQDSLPSALDLKIVPQIDGADVRCGPGGDCRVLLRVEDELYSPDGYDLSFSTVELAKSSLTTCTFATSLLDGSNPRRLEPFSTRFRLRPLEGKKEGSCRLHLEVRVGGNVHSVTKSIPLKVLVRKDESNPH